MSYKKTSFSTFGFTLIELLIAIAIVGIIAVVAFVALDPARRFAEARNATRWSDVTAVLDAAKLHQVDQRGTLHANFAEAILPARVGLPNMIVDGTVGVGVACTTAIRAAGTTCDVAIATVESCVDMSYLTTGTPSYLGALPEGQLSADVGRLNWSTVAGDTGYYVTYNANGSLTVGSCDGERATIIRIQK